MVNSVYFTIYVYIRLRAYTYTIWLEPYILRSGINLRLRHLTSKENLRADLLSRLLLSDYSQRFPSDRVRTFSPPRDLLPARWRTCF